MFHFRDKVDIPNYVILRYSKVQQHVMKVLKQTITLREKSFNVMRMRLNLSRGIVLCIRKIFVEERMY